MPPLVLLLNGGDLLLEELDGVPRCGGLLPCVCRFLLGRLDCRGVGLDLSLGCLQLPAQGSCVRLGLVGGALGCGCPLACSVSIAVGGLDVGVRVPPQPLEALVADLRGCLDLLDVVAETGDVAPRGLDVPPFEK